jgi:protein tyrosine/serine phosphatase
MIYKIKLIVSLLMVCTALSATAQEINYKEKLLGEGLPIINATDEKDVLPGNFRTSKVLRLPSKETLNLDGLDQLNASGSAQFSELSLDAALSAISKQAGKRHVTIVNLRQENGGFLEPAEGLGAVAFSYLMSMPWWTGENPAGTRSVAEIEASEEKAMADITSQHKFTVYGSGDSYAPADQHNVLYKVDMVVKRALTEKTLAAEKGLGYFRIPDKKFGNMEYEHVDLFVNSMKNLPADEWVHFHCKKGKSRTTLFMIMYDMLRNADKATPEEIIKRQGPLGIGGTDMKDFPDANEWDYSFKKGWKDFLFQFHAYAKANKHNNFETSWSTWAEEQGIVPAPPVVLGEHYKETNVTSNLPTDEDNLYTAKTLVVNTINEGKMKVSNFRSSEDIWLSNDLKFNKTGLESLHASGSNQYTKIGIGLLIEELKKQHPHVVVVDLRHDDHLFINGLNVSTFETKEALLEPRTPDAIRASVNALKADLLNYSKVELHAIDTKYPKNVFEDRLTITLKPTLIETPEELVTKLGADYLLIGNKRFSSISDDDITRFISYARTMPEDTWYHFHCKKGKSRTTMFLTILDMMRNADKLGMEDIINRQYLIGGINLFNITAKDATWDDEKEAKRQWVVFLARFHRYAQENKATNFAMTWTEWSEKNKDYVPNVDHLVIDNTPKA